MTAMMSMAKYEVHNHILLRGKEVVVKIVHNLSTNAHFIVLLGIPFMRA